jgi:hypothetical protein
MLVISDREGERLAGALGERRREGSYQYKYHQREEGPALSFKDE